MSWRARIGDAAFALLIGCIFVWFNFNGLFRHFAKTTPASESSFSESVISISLFPKHILSSSPEALYLWMLVCFAGIWVYVGAILLLAVVRGRALAGWGLMGLVGGGILPALLCWAALLVWGIFKVIGIILGFIGYALGVIITWIVKALIFAFPVLIVIALVVAVIWVWKAHGPKLLLFGAAGAVVFYFLLPALEFILEKIGLVLVWIAEKISQFLTWIGHILAFLFGWLPIVLMWLIKVVAVVAGITTIIGMVGCVGQILIDQFKTAFDAGKGQKAVLTASVSIGLSMALILLVAAGSPATAIAQRAPTSSIASRYVATSRTGKITTLAKQKKRRKKSRQQSKPTITAPAAVVPPPPPPVPMANIATTIDRAWTNSTWIFKTVSPTGIFMAMLPSAVEDWARKTFRTATAPIFDAIVLAFVAALSLIGLLRGILTRSEFEYKMRFYNRDLIAIAVVPLIVVFLALAATEANQE